MITLDSEFIHEDVILHKIYVDAVNKFFDEASKRIVFMELCDYVYRKLTQKKQCCYSNVLFIVKEVCQKIGESFSNGVEHYAPDAKCYRDIYFAIY